MKKLLIGLSLIGFVIMSSGASSRRHEYKDRRLQEEFDALWYAIAYPGNVFARTMQITHQPCARAWRNGAQGISNQTTTKVQLNAETYDVGSDFDSSTNYRFDVPITGYYQINTSIYFDSDRAHKMIITIYKNGTEIVGKEVVYPAAATFDSISVSDIAYLTSGDYVELYFWHNDGRTLNIQGIETKTFLSIRLVQ